MGHESNRSQLARPLVITTPLVLVDSDDMAMFSSPEALTLKLEPWYVRGEEYDVFDSAGREIKLGLEVRSRSYFGGLFKGDVEFVIVKCVETEPRHTRELRAALIDGLAAAGHATGALERASLETLIDVAVKEFGFDD